MFHFFASFTSYLQLDGLFYPYHLKGFESNHCLRKTIMKIPLTWFNVYISMFEVFNGQSRSMKIVKPSLHGHIIIKTSNFHHCKNCPSLMHPYQIFRQWDQHSRNWHTARYPCHVILHNINLSGQAQFYIISHIWQHSHMSPLYENRNKQQKEQSPDS